MHLLRYGMILAVALLTAAPASAQTNDRDATLAHVRRVLASAGQRSDVNVSFVPATKNAYNTTGTMTIGLKNADSLEIVVSVTKNNTIAFRVWPHYKGGYINTTRARDPSALMRQLLRFSDDNFLFWGADEGGDVFSGYTFTLESGIPDDAIIIVLRSIKNTDTFVGQMRPAIDGTAAL